MLAIATDHLLLLLAAARLVEWYLIGFVYATEERQLAVCAHRVFFNLLPHLKILAELFPFWQMN